MMIKLKNIINFAIDTQILVTKISQLLMFSTPILIITYKREKSLQKIFNIVKKLNPKKLYISSNASPKNDLKVFNKVCNVRKIINNLKINGKVQIGRAHV